MSKTINLSLDTSKSDIQNPKILLRQGDGNYQTLRVTITSNGEPADLTNADVIYLGTTAADKKIIDSNVTKVDALNGVIDYQPPKQWGQDMGNFKNSYFEITTGESTGSTASFKVSVLEAVDLNAEESGDYITVVDGIVTNVRKELNDQLADVKLKTDNATGLVKQVSDDLVAVVKNYNDDITNKYNAANDKATAINNKFVDGNYANKLTDNTFNSHNQFSGFTELQGQTNTANIDVYGQLTAQHDATVKGNLTVSGSIHGKADTSGTADIATKADSAITADTATNAKNADKATTAVNADFATKANTAIMATNANHASVADTLTSANNQTIQDLTVNGQITVNQNQNTKYVKTVDAASSIVTEARRTGNVVDIVLSGMASHLTTDTWVGVIPAGYRPFFDVRFAAVSAFSKVIILKIQPDGKMFVTSISEDANQHGLEAYTEYLTKDAMPS